MVGAYGMRHRDAAGVRNCAVRVHGKPHHRAFSGHLEAMEELPGMERPPGGRKTASGYLRIDAWRGMPQSPPGAFQSPPGHSGIVGHSEA